MRFLDMVIYLLPSFVSFYLISDAVIHIFELGKSKSHLKKIRKSYTFGQRIAMKHISADNCKYYKKTVRWLLLIRKVYLIVFAVFSLFAILTFVSDKLYIAWSWGIRGKGIIIDVPIMLYFFTMTKFDLKHGGITWRYTKDE